MKRMFMLLILFFPMVLFSAETIRDSNTGEVFPSKVSFTYDGKNYELDATGVSTRKKLFVKIYSVASYLQDGGNGITLADIMSPDKAKQISIKWLRNIDGKRIQGGYEDALKNSLSEEMYSKLDGVVEEFLAFFKNGVKTGEEDTFRWIPGGYVEVLVDGKSIGTINNVEFAKGLWGIWFGDHSVVDRSRLLQK